MTVESGLLHDVHDSSMSAHPLVFRHDADTQADAVAGPNAKAPPVSVNADTDTVAHQDAEEDEVGPEGDEVDVEGCGDSQSQSHTAQQVCGILSLSVSVAQSFHCMRFQVCCGDRVWCGACACVSFFIPAGLSFSRALLH